LKFPNQTFVRTKRAPLLNSTRVNEASGLFSHQSKAGLTSNMNCLVLASQVSKCASVVIRTIHCDRHCPVVSVTPDKKQMKYDTRPFMRRESQNILGMFRQGRWIFPRHVSTPHKPPCELFSLPHTAIFHCTVVAKYISLSPHCACEKRSPAPCRHLSRVFLNNRIFFRVCEARQYIVSAV